jgi:hypothetical protein
LRATRVAVLLRHRAALVVQAWCTAAGRSRRAAREQDVLGLDLVAAMRRQESFMRSMLARRALLEARDCIEAAVRDYCAFLRAMRHSECLEPSPLVDLVRALARVPSRAAAPRGALARSRPRVPSSASLWPGFCDLRALSLFLAEHDARQVWHTHQQMPERYRRDCLQIAGRLIDHDDTPERTASIQAGDGGGGEGVPLFTFAG